MSTATDTRKVGIFGFEFDTRFGTEQIYTDGAPVREGDKVIHTQESGLLPGVTTSGTAEFCPWGHPGELYVKYAEGRYAHMNGAVVRDLS